MVDLELIISKLSLTSLKQQNIVPKECFVYGRSILSNKRYPKAMYPLDKDLPFSKHTNVVVTRRHIFNEACRTELFKVISQFSPATIKINTNINIFKTLEQVWNSFTSNPLPDDLSTAHRFLGDFSGICSDFSSGNFSTNVPLIYPLPNTLATIKTTLDFVGSNLMYDIGFPVSVKRDEAWNIVVLKALAKFSIAKDRGAPFTHLGLILPISKQAIYANLTDWDHTKLLKEITDMITTLDDQLTVHTGYINREVGYHIQKGKNLTETLKLWCSGKMMIPTLDLLINGLPDDKLKNLSSEVIDRLIPSQNRHNCPPCQVFLRSPQAEYSSANMSDMMVLSINGIIKQHNGRLFVHTPYILNLARDNVNTKALTEDLSLCSSMNGKGVVVHVGKSLTMQNAYKNMKRNILSCILASTKECPLLLETPAGQGTEMLTDIDDMILFILEVLEDMPNPNINGFGLCIDTCHVFALGYNPVYYLDKINKAFPKLGIVKLIHLNDSETPCGSRVDRHHPMGGGFTSLLNTTLNEFDNPGSTASPLGHIGLKRLAGVIKLATELRIPMVIE